MPNTPSQEIIRNFRLQHGFSIERLSRELGVTARTIYRWERGITQPSPRIMKRFEKLRFRLTANLTTREQEVLILIARGNSIREIASLSYTSEDTVKTHVRNICQKLGFSNKNELINYAIQQGLAD